MTKTTNDLTKQVMLKESEHGGRIFRNNVGSGWVCSRYKRNKNGSITLINPRRIKFGLFKGSADLIGIRPVVITADMVGQTVGVFTSYEIKHGSDTMKPEQRIWHRMISRLGGIAQIIRSEDEVKK